MRWVAHWRRCAPSSIRAVCELSMKPENTRLDQPFAQRYGPVALVTGASSGIGRSFAECLAARGMNLVLVARRAQRLEELAARFANQYGVQTTICALDLAAPTAAQRVLDATASLDRKSTRLNSSH